MSLNPCPDCTQPISSSAFSCPHCGRPSGRTGAPVHVTNVDMEFGTMIGIIIKAALASIPAAIILFVLGAVVVGIFGGMGHR